MYQLNVGFQIAKQQSLVMKDLQNAADASTPSSHRTDCVDEH